MDVYYMGNKQSNNINVLYDNIVYQIGVTAGNIQLHVQYCNEPIISIPINQLHKMYSKNKKMILYFTHCDDPLVRDNQLVLIFFKTDDIYKFIDMMS